MAVWAAGSRSSGAYAVHSVCICPMAPSTAGPVYQLPNMSNHHRAVPSSSASENSRRSPAIVAASWGNPAWCPGTATPSATADFEVWVR